ncbi:hypothetical protein RSAG8_06852, partial [Rhizoctonia solani AG-8 WAC10335]
MYIEVDPTPSSGADPLRSSRPAHNAHHSLFKFAIHYMILSNGLLGLLLFAGSVLTQGLQTPCSDFQLVFLVGATETKRPGNVGGPLSKALASAAPGITTYSVPYDNGFRFKTSILKGATMTVQHIKKQAELCPNQRFVLGGYSKGAMVIHSMKLSDHIKKKIAAIVVFGDPLHNITTSRSWPIDSPVVNLNPRSGFNNSQNVASFCNRGDITGGKQHLVWFRVVSDPDVYPDDSTELAAAFIGIQARMKSTIV